MAHGIEAFVRLAPALWSGEMLPIQPGDLSRFAPLGIGLGAPLVMMPSDDVGAVISRGTYYGFYSHSGHPFSGVPITEAGGGTIYFSEHCEWADVEATLRLMGVYGHLTDYAAFLQEAMQPKDRYLTQLRIVSGFALKYAFRASDTPEGMALQDQPLPISEVIWRFIEWFRDATAEGR